MLSFLRSLFTRPARRPVLPASPATSRLGLEVLEDRSLPSASSVFASLLDAPLRTAAQASYAPDAAVGRTDMIGLFRLAAKDLKVTSTELSDLKKLVANGTELGMPLYVRELSGKVVGYDLANRFYQGHALVAKGQFVVGNTSVQLNQLVNKWFLGADLPVAKDDDGKVWGYRLASGTLFGSAGPRIGDIVQGWIGDCYYLSTLGSIAARNPQALRNMFLNNGDGTFTVRFFRQVNGTQVEKFVTVNLRLPTDGAGNFIFANWQQPMSRPTNVLWVALAEKAYAQLAESGWSRQTDASGNSVPPRNSYYVISGGFGDEPMQQIMGVAATHLDRYPGQLRQGDITALITALGAGKLVTVASGSWLPSYSPVVEDHEYYVTGYNATTRRFIVVNPWGAYLPEIGTLSLTAGEMMQYFCEYDTAASSATHQKWW